MALTPKQSQFVAEYIVDLNGAAAARRAGYSEHTAREIAAQLMAKPEVLAAIEQAKRERIERTEITADRVLQELARLAFSDPRKFYRPDGSMKAPHELDDDTAATLASIDVIEITNGMAIEIPGLDLVDEIEPQAHGGGLRRQRKALITLVKKAKVFDKVAALGLAMKHLGMLKEKVEHTGNVTITATPHDERL